MSNLIDIILPQGQLEGTSATLAAWLVKEGDSVSEGAPLAELETDKVVMEVCAEKAGIIESLSAQVGDEVMPEQSLGKLNLSANELAPTANQAGRNLDQYESNTNNQSDKASIESTPLCEDDSASNEDDSARNFVSPAVRRLLRENNLDIENITGSGKRGRVTRDDVLAYINNPQPREVAAKLSEQSTQPPLASAPFESLVRDSRPLQGKKIPHSNMRKSIASHMVESLLHTSPHVTSVFEMDMGNIIEHRKWHKKEFSQMGVKLTFTAYFLAAMATAIKAVPQVNARFHEDSLEIFDDVNIGIGTALGDAGLVVPVVEQVQTMNLFEIAKNLNLMTDKARDGKLKPSDMKNGSITISNHGVSGSLFATPIIINQPQVAILGVGKLEKRVVVESVNGVDTMVIRPKCYVSLSIDHRALDAHQTNQFLSVFVETIENWGE
ncbi:dihydrolipoamide acetyltransferase family protein [Aliikangiella sp. IMCC44632]